MAEYDQKVVQDDSQSPAQRIAEYAATVDDANKCTLTPIVVELTNGRPRIARPRQT